MRALRLEETYMMQYADLVIQLCVVIACVVQMEWSDSQTDRQTV
jgi:hypothetical protein